MGISRTIGSTLVLAAVAASVAAPAHAQSFNRLAAMCNGKHGSRAQLTGCAALLTRFKLSQANRAIAYNKRGLAYANLRQYRKAIADYTLALRINPRDATAYNNRANAFGKLGDYASYLKDCERLLRLKPGDGDALNCKAWALFKLNRPTEALPVAEAALRASPKDGNIWNTRAHVHQALGNEAQAIADYKEAIALDPKLEDSKKALKRLGVTP